MRRIRAFGRWLSRPFRRRRHAKADAAELVGVMPQVDLDDRLFYPAADRDPLVDGAFDDAELMSQPAAGFRADELLMVGAARDRPALDPRRRAAIDQRLALDGGVIPSWRSGDHGHVVQVDDGREAFVLTEPVARRSAETSLERLVRAGDLVARRLAERHLAVDLRWPEEVLVGYDGGIDGYIGPSLGAAFLQEVRKGTAVRTIASLGAAAQKAGEQPLSPDERLALLANLGGWIGSLHEENVVHGGLRPATVAFRRSDLGVTPVDYVNTRPLGSGPWAVARPRAAEDPSVEDDRIGFAHLVLKVLSPESEGDPLRFMKLIRDVDGLGASARADVFWLAARLPAGVKGAPAVEEWLAALDTPKR